MDIQSWFYCKATFPPEIMSTKLSKLGFDTMFQGYHCKYVVHGASHSVAILLPVQQNGNDSIIENSWKTGKRTRKYRGNGNIA